MKPLLPPLLILLAGFFAYHNSFTAPFVFDDLTLILENARVIDPGPLLLRSLLAPQDFNPFANRPTLQLTFALNYALGRANPWGYHVVNLSIHLLGALFLFGIVRRTLEQPRLKTRYGSASGGLAAAVALLWVTHPLQTESVTYIWQRGESLMGLAILLTLYSVIRSVQSPHPRPWKILAVTACAWGMGVKQLMVVAPFLVLIYDRIFLGSSWKAILRQRKTLYLWLAATCGIVVFLLATGPNEIPSNAGFSFKRITPWEYARTQPGVLLHYLRLAFWPHPLVLDYYWPVARTAGEIIPPALAIAALALATAWALRRRPALGFVGIWFFLILLPISSVIPTNDPAAEHRMYLPLAAVITALVGGGWHLLSRRISSLGLRNAVAAALVLSTSGLLVWVTIQRNHDYGSPLRLWSQTVANRPENPRAHNQLGKTLAELGRGEEALAHYRQALRLKPNYPQALNNVGVLLAERGEVEGAIAHYHWALRLDPDYAQAHNNLGVELTGQGHLEEAVAHYRRALELKAGFADAHNNLGNALARQGKLEEAIRHYEEALRLKPDLAQVRHNLGLALQALRQTEPRGPEPQPYSGPPQSSGL